MKNCPTLFILLTASRDLLNTAKELTINNIQELIAKSSSDDASNQEFRTWPYLIPESSYL